VPYQQDLAYIQSIAFGAFARGAAPEIVRRLKTATIPVRHVLEVGCGAGPLTAALTDAGFDVTAIEPSADLIAIARSAAPTAHFIRGSVYDVPLPPLDAIVALGEPLTYHDNPDDADRLLDDFFDRAAATLPAGGQLIFDMIETGEPSLAARGWRSGEDWALLFDISEDTASKTLVRNIEVFRRIGDLYRRSREVHRVRLFDTASLRAQLESRGFLVETAASYGTQELLPRRTAFFAVKPM
jgi:SAM-dependent methyltransferase